MQLFRFIVHKTTGTSRVVCIEAQSMEFTKGGVLAFYIGNRLVMAYPPHAWKSVYEEELHET